MKCCIVKDLLPNYIDGLTSKETNTEIEKHLAECVECHIIYEQMKAELSEEIKPEEKDVDFLKKWKGRIRRRYVIVALSTGIFLTCAVLVLGTYRIPVAYDPDCMTAAIYQTASVPNSFGLKEWRDLDTLDPESAEAVKTEKYDIRDELQFVRRQSAGSDGFTSCGRTMRRDGENIRVVYYCYTRTLWNSMFPAGSSFADQSVVKDGIYGSDFSRDVGMEYQQEKTEVYYLPIRNLNRLDGLSDEEFDAQKKDAVLVWSGVI